MENELGKVSRRMASDTTSRRFFRFHPYATRNMSRKEDIREEVIRLGVKFSVCIAESMFLLCDETRNMLWFCYKLWRGAVRNWDPVFESMLRVIHYVYLKDIKPKNGVFRDGAYSLQWELIRTTWKEFTYGIIILHSLFFALTSKNFVFDDRILLSAIAKYKQVLKNLEDKLRFAEDVSKANGFARETIEYNVFYMWTSLFVDEASSEATSKVKNDRFVRDMFTPLLDESNRSASGFISHSEILALPEYSPPYILGEDFAKQVLKEEAVQLGVELSLYVAESMFLLCDDIRSILRFCYKLWIDTTRDPDPDSLVLEKLLLVFHYVYLRDIQPKNGVYQNGGRSVQWKLTRKTWENFVDGIRDLEQLVLMLRGEWSCSNGRGLTTSIEESLKKIEEKLRCVKTVSEANGFTREAMESSFLDLWKSVFDKELKEATQTLEVINEQIFDDLFLPLFNEAEQP